MALIDQVRTILNRLAPRGWKNLLQQHGLDITAADLATELERQLPLIRSDLPGFTEFSLAGTRAIEPGRPARSLLYHALASADVHPTAGGEPSQDPADYPTLSELDTIENYVYGRAKRRLDDFANPVIAVFAYQYRPALRSPHGKYADLAFSRTGVARIGTEPHRYDAMRRSFTPTPKNGRRDFAVLPARYAAFIAEYRSPSADDCVMRSVSIDSGMTFLFPAHKLFPGKECLFDAAANPVNISSLSFVEYHINEKLRRIHTATPDNPGRIAPLQMFDINKPPFVRDSRNGAAPVMLEKTNASILVVPLHHPSLVRTATQKVGNRDETTRFAVPPENNDNRFWTSLQLPFGDNGRSAPEYANIRHEVVVEAGQQKTIDLNDTLNNAEFETKLSAGGYEAAHFIDDTCDGAVGVKVGGLRLPVLCAYSLVAAIDLFPLIDQAEIQEWIERTSHRPTGFNDPSAHFAQGGPRPLCDGRFNRLSGNPKKSFRLPNPTLRNPTETAQPTGPAFLRSEAANLTATAIVGRAATGSSFKLLSEPRHAISWLTDSAADVFAPGWDISEHGDQGGPFYTSYGLGSPFPEDAKLCAALNSFWPAAAPDTSRSFRIAEAPTAMPLLDSELGYHPDHPRVKGGEVGSGEGWDGEFGPFFETVNGALVVNFADRNRSDYVSNALRGLLGFCGMDAVRTEEMIDRMEALRACINTLPPKTDSVPTTRLWLVTVERVADWANWNSAVNLRADAALAGSGHIYIFVTTTGSPSPVGDPARRNRIDVRDRFECQLDRQVILWRRNNEPLQRAVRPPAR